MILFKKNEDLKSWIQEQNRCEVTIGFVPTMGALHQGHLSLIDASRQNNGKTICSIFVNPTQFNDPKDFEKYPVTFEKDIELLINTGCDVLFLPTVSEIYPNGDFEDKNFDLGFLETILDGKYRPGHFQGVCKVVSRLLEIVQPDNLYLGQKDYQQCMVINRLVVLLGLNKKIKINICPTLRELDGLAMSSRNMRLNIAERKTAITIYQTLEFIKSHIEKGNLEKLQQDATKILERIGFKVDYVAIANATTLSPILNWDGEEKLVALIAAFLNEIRLIDNMVLN